MGSLAFYFRLFVETNMYAKPAGTLGPRKFQRLDFDVKQCLPQSTQRFAPYKDSLTVCFRSQRCFCSKLSVDAL